MKDYRKYKLSVKQLLLAGAGGGSGAGFIIGILIPNRWVIGLGLIIGGIAGPIFWRNYKQRSIQNRLRYEFRECLGMMIPVLRAGRSIEGAIEALCEDMVSEEFQWIYIEMRSIRNGLRLHEPIEELFKEFGERSGITDIQDFAEILYVSKRRSGDIIEVMEYTAQVIEEKMEAEEDIRVILAKKKLEQRIMGIMPFGIIAMLRIMSPDYLEPLYTSVQGGIIMWICIILIAISFYLAGSISKISI